MPARKPRPAALLVTGALVLAVALTTVVATSTGTLCGPGQLGRQNIRGIRIDASTDLPALQVHHRGPGLAADFQGPVRFDGTVTGAISVTNDLDGARLVLDGDGDTSLASEADDHVRLTSGTSAGLWSVLVGNLAGADLTIFYNGTQLSTSGSVTRVLKRLPRLSPFALKPDGILVGAMDVIAEQGDPPADAMKLTLSMTHRIVGRHDPWLAHPSGPACTGLHSRSVLRFALRLPSHTPSREKPPVLDRSLRAVAFGSRLPPVGSAKDFHLQSCAHARRTKAQCPLSWRASRGLDRVLAPAYMSGAGAPAPAISIKRSHLIQAPVLSNRWGEVPISVPRGYYDHRSK